MKNFIIFTLLLYLSLGCTSEPSDPVERNCNSKSDCPDTQDCRFVGLASETGTCVDRTKCFIDGDCSDQRICASYKPNLSYCGYSLDEFKITTDSSLLTAYFRENYSIQLQLQGVTAPFSFQIKNSTLPVGLTLSESGLISGVPTEAVENHSFTVIAINGAPESTYFYNYRGHEKNFTITTINDLCRGVDCSSAINSSCISGECVCNSEYHKIPENITGSCELNQIQTNCTNSLPENATWDSVNPDGVVTQNWNENTQTYEPSADSCLWSCNQNYHSFNGVCDLNQIQTNCTNSLPKYATWTTENTNGWIIQHWSELQQIYEPSSDSCIWDCNLEQTKLSQDGTACECDSTLGYFENNKTVCGEIQNIFSCTNLVETYVTSSNQSSPLLTSSILFEGFNSQEAKREFIKGYICWDMAYEFLDEICQDITFDNVSELYKATLSIGTEGNYYYRFKFSGDGEKSFTECIPLGIAMIQPPVEGDLFISEYIEGAALNKALEIYNPTSQPISLDDYELWMGVNGKVFTDSSSKKLLLNTVITKNPLPAGEVLVIANNGADPLIKEKANLLTPDNTGFCTWTGDDAIALVKNGVIIDIIGVEGQGSNWAVAGVASATKDHILVRKAGRDFGNTNWEQSAGTTIENSEWIISIPPLDIPVSGYLGTHQN